jgi:hypothetical protein
MSSVSHWLLFHPNLIADLRGEILQWCKSSVLGLVCLLSKDWHKSAVVHLDKILNQGFKFFIYNEPNDRISMNWWGTYSYGSVHIRGTSINLIKGKGRVLDLEHDKDTDDYPPDTEADLESIHAPYRNDQTSMRLHDFNEIVELSKMTPEELEYLGMDIDWMSEYGTDPLFNAIRIGTYTGTVLDGDYQQRYGKLHCIDDYDTFIEELERINVIAKRHNVTFFWV